MGPGAVLGARAVVVSHAGVSIGPRAVLGDWAALSDAAPSFANVEAPVRAQPVESAPIVVGAGAAVGPHAVLGPGAVVAAGDVVAPYAVVGPASGPLDLYGSAWGERHAERLAGEGVDRSRAADGHAR